MLARVAQNGAGMVTAKSCGPVPRAGHPNPVVIAFDGGVLNAVGLSNPGVQEQVKWLAKAREKLHALDTPLIASMFGRNRRGVWRGCCHFSYLPARHD